MKNFVISCITLTYFINYLGSLLCFMSHIKARSDGLRKTQWKREFSKLLDFSHG